MTSNPAGPLHGAPHTDVLFFSHLRWDFVFQRPQHIVSRWRRDHRVWFCEEPLPDDGPPRLEIRRRGRVKVIVPRIPAGVDAAPIVAELLRELCEDAGVREPIGWFWTPMMLAYARRLDLSTVVWDCMDELRGFKFAPPELVEWEERMLARADVVFTGGYQLYDSKRHLHPNVHPLPSSVDRPHFAQAREDLPDPVDQRHLPRPRIGWFGVIDERTDLALLDSVAAEHPEWHFVMIGPIVKIDESTVPRRPNLHWLGMKSYEELPAYVGHWDVAILPFAHNESTRYISPTKTPEYLAAGRPVVSTSIADVVNPYGVQDLVRIADGPAAFGRAIAEALAEDGDERRARADAFLAELSWESTVGRMQDLVSAARALVLEP